MGWYILVSAAMVILLYFIIVVVFVHVFFSLRYSVNIL
jgi:hypothetical protein